MIRNRAPWLMMAGLLAVLISGCAATHQDRAQQFYSQGRLDEADYEIQKALAADPNNLSVEHLAAEIFTGQGFAHYKRGEMIAAGNYFHRAIDYYPTYAPAYDYLGLIAFSQHNWQDAIKYGDQSAGYSGQPAPGYVHHATEELRRIRSGQPLFRSRRQVPKP